MTEAAARTAPRVGSRGWTGERPGGRLGNGFFTLLVRCGGLRLAPLFVAFVALWFVLTRPAQRRGSAVFAKRLGLAHGALGGLWFAWRHFYTYGLMLVDRLAMLGGHSNALRITIVGEQELRAACRSGRGAVLVTAHFGNWAAMGQTAARIGVPLTLLMYEFEGMAPTLREQLQRSEAGRLFSVLNTDGGAGTAAAALDLLRRGEAIGMMGDRVFAGRKAVVPFIGGEVAFPVGPYVLAATAGALLVVAFLLRTGMHRYTLHAVSIPVEPLPARQDRAAVLRCHAAAFAGILETKVREHPLQWGNFHDLWAAEAGR